MPSSYTTNNGLVLPATGENNNTWGALINDSATSLIDTALDGVVTLSLTGTTHALAITDGAASDGRNRILVCTGTLAANNTITLSPNDAEKYFFVYNNTTGGFSVIFAQGGGSGSTVTIANGYWAIVRCDGTGTNANVTRVLDSLELGGTIKVAGLSVTSAISGADGSAAAPTYSFTSDTNTGVYRVGADSLGVSAGGTLRVTIDTTGVTLTIPLLAAAGSASAPSHSFSSDTNTGMYSVGADQVGIATGGTLRETISTTAITSTLPLLGAAGSAAAPQYSFSGDTNTGMFSSAADDVSFSIGGTLIARFFASLGFQVNGVVRSVVGSIEGFFAAGQGGAFGIGTVSNHEVLVYQNNTERARIDTSGNLAIASTTAYQKLTVQGQGVFMDTATTLNPNDSAGDCLRVGVDSGTGRGYVTASDGAAGTKAVDVLASSVCIPSTVIIGAAAGSSAGPYSALQVDSTTQGFMPPRMTTAQRDAMGSASDGVIIFNSTTSKFQGRAGGAWVDFH